MKYLLLYCASFLFFYFPVNFDCDKLSNGKYLVHFTQGAYKDLRIKIQDNTFVKYLNNHDSACGKINWIYKCIFSMKYATKNDMDTVRGPIKLAHASWGEPCIELEEVKGDTIQFRMTYSANLHITINKGYFLKESY